MFYRPNTMRAEELSRNPVANALAVTFLMVSEQVFGTPSRSLSTFHEASHQHWRHSTLHLHQLVASSLSELQAFAERRLLLGSRALPWHGGSARG